MSNEVKSRSAGSSEAPAPILSGKSRKAGKTIYIVITCLMIFLYGGISFANVSQGNWRWRNDDGDVYSAKWKDSLNTPVVITDYENIRLRTEVSFGTHDTSKISLRYTEDIYNSLYLGNYSSWIPVTGVDTGKFYISPSLFLSDTISYFDNQLLLPRDTFFTYRKTVTFDYTDSYSLIGDSSSIYELEYSILPTLKVQPGSAYFFSLFDDSVRMFSGYYIEYPVLMTSPVSWIHQSFESDYSNYYLNDVCFIDENTGMAVGSGWNQVNSGGLILKTIDGGVTWTQKNCPAEVVNLSSVCFINKNAGTAVGYDGVIIRTTDGGETWKKQNSGTNTYSLLDVSFTNTDTGTAVGYQCSGLNCTNVTGIILRTTDGGENWNKQSYQINKALLAVCFSSADIGTIIGADGTIIRTTNGGNDWNTQSSGVTGSSFNDIFFTDANNGTVVGQRCDTYNCYSLILKTTNGGTTWWKSFEEPGPYLNSVYFVDQNTGWAVGGAGCILKTTDGGLNWNKLVSGSSKELYAVHFVNKNTGWVVGYQSKILKTTNGGITSTVEERESRSTPVNFYLSQNYPNPFNPSTTIKYSIPSVGTSLMKFVQLKIYDVLGNEIATLVNEEKPAGYYKVNWNAVNLSSGVYFYQLKAGSYTATKKLLLLK